MTDATQYPTLDRLTSYLALPHCDGARLSTSGLMCKDVAAELTALKAENTQLREELAHAREALAPRPVRKLREYVSESCGARYRVSSGRIQFLDVFESEWCEPHAVNVDDVVALADLLANPFEPVETVDNVLDAALTRAYNGGAGNLYPNWEGTDALVKTTAEKVRAAVLAEVGGDADA